LVKFLQICLKKLKTLVAFWLKQRLKLKMNFSNVSSTKVKNQSQ